MSVGSVANRRSSEATLYFYRLRKLAHLLVGSELVNFLFFEARRPAAKAILSGTWTAAIVNDFCTLKVFTFRK
jgi:hypothetical protein